MIEVRKVTDPEEIKTILTDPEIYDRITDDKCPSRDKYVFNDAGAEFYGGYLGDKLIGIVIDHDGQIHVNILKDYRQHKREFLRAVLSRIDRDRIFAKVPSLFPSIIQWAKEEGFKEERVIKDGYLKNGKSYDTHIMVFVKNELY